MQEAGAWLAVSRNVQFACTSVGSAKAARRPRTRKNVEHQRQRDQVIDGHIQRQRLSPHLGGHQPNAAHSQRQAQPGGDGNLVPRTAGEAAQGEHQLRP